MMLVLGITLCLGGLAHSVGVAHMYVTKGAPDINRVLLDVWIAEAQLLGGALYVVAYRALRAGRPWHIAAMAGALTVLSYAVAFIPVVFIRDPVIFRIAPVIYFSLSLVILVRAVAASRTPV